jgi:hypothetical protein
MTESYYQEEENGDLDYHRPLIIYSEFFLRLAIGFYMLIFQPHVNFCIQTIFGTKLEDFLNYRIDYNLISQTVEKVVKKICLGSRNNSTSSGRQSSAIVGSRLNQHLTISTFGRFRRAKTFSNLSSSSLLA